MRSRVRHDVFGRERIGVCLDLDDIGGIVLMRMMRACRLVCMCAASRCGIDPGSPPCETRSNANKNRKWSWRIGGRLADR